ncbi:hypothetical protein Q8A73_024576 [Channa argus]|nr:hypothetical protein Q8A73_024576 [Channa argus]
MMSGLAEGGRDVPDLPLKLDTIFVASLLQDMASEVGHPASLGMKYFFLYAARGILNWSNVGPRSEQLPWHYAWVAKWLRSHPEALEDGIWKQQSVLYRVVRGKVNPSPLLGVPSSVTVGVQAVGQSNGLKDLNWAFLHRTLPVRDKIHRHGLGRSPLCPRPSCGAGETAYHVIACAQGGHALLYVFPLPVAIRRPLARTIFNFLWGGRYEWVARGRMMSGLAEGGRDVPDLPLKLDTIFVASLLQDMASEVGHPASLGMKYFFLYAARGILNWSNVGPRSEQLPWHYAWVAKWLRAHPEALEDGIWKQQRVLYRVVRGKVNPSPLLGVPSSVTVGVQAVGQSNGLKDLNWAFLHRTLPVRDKIHRHGLGRSPLCPRPSCGAGETAYHVMWECSFARQL